MCIFAESFLAGQSIMQHEALLYSLDPDITFSQLKEQDIFGYDTARYAKLQEWADENNIRAMMDSDIDFHYRLLPIRPKVHLFYYL